MTKLLFWLVTGHISTKVLFFLFLIFLSETLLLILLNIWNTNVQKIVKIWRLYRKNTPRRSICFPLCNSTVNSQSELRLKVEISWLTRKLEARFTKLQTPDREKLFFMVHSPVNVPWMVLVGYKKRCRRQQQKSSITHLGLSLQYTPLIDRDGIKKGWWLWRYLKHRLSEPCLKSSIWMWEPKFCCVIVRIVMPSVRLQLVLSLHQGWVCSRGWGGGYLCVFVRYMRLNSTQ